MEMGNKIKIAIAESKSEVRETIRKAVEMYPGWACEWEASNGQEALAIAPLVDVIVMSINLSVIDGITCCQMIQDKYPACLVILCALATDEDIYRKAMRAGAADCLIKPVSLETLYDSIGTALKRNNTRIVQPKISKLHSKVIGFHSGKGGVGNTTLTVNTAIALQKRINNKILIIDEDLQHANVETHFSGANSVMGFDSLLAYERQSSITWEEIQTIIMQRGDIDIIACCQRLETSDTINREHVGYLLSLAKEQYEYILVDASSQINDNTDAIFQETDMLFISSEATIPSLKETKILLQILKTLGHNKPIHVVINKFRDNCGIEINDIESQLRCNITSKIPYLPCMDRLVNTGHPLMSLSQHKTKEEQETANAINNIVDTILGKQISKEDNLLNGFKRIFGY